nr:actin-binding, cofilin/tropomyosin type [Tanacetum cinerariifolium]
MHNIMAAGSRDRPPMLAPGRYAQWRSRFMRYIDTKDNCEALKKCLEEGPYVPSTVIILAKHATETSETVEEHSEIETLANMYDANKAHFKAEKETIHMLLTGIRDKIYSTIGACNTAHEMWIAIKRLQQGKSLNVQDVKTNLFWEFGKFTSRDGESTESYYTRFYKMMNEMISCNYIVKGKEIARPITPLSESASEEDSDPEQAQRDKDMQKTLALIAKYFKKIYKPTNNNLRTSSNSRNKHVDTYPRYVKDNQIGQFRNQRRVTVAGAKETECRKPKMVKDYTYHKEKMLLSKQAEEDLGTDAEPLEKVQYDDEYNVFSNEKQHSEQPDFINNTCAVEKVDRNVILDSPDICDNDDQADQNDEEYDDERVALANVIANLTLDTKENKKILKQLKKANASLSQELKECKSTLEETTRALGESNSTRDSCYCTSKPKDRFHVPTAKDVSSLVEVCLMPLAIKTQNENFKIVHELKQEMFADLEYAKSLEKEIDELKYDKAVFSNIYDLLLQECVSKDVMFSYMHSLPDLTAQAELQCLYVHKVKECECLAEKLLQLCKSMLKTRSPRVMSSIDKSMAAFWVIDNQFQKFIDWQYFMDYDSQMTEKFFAEYTEIKVTQFRETLLQHMGNVKKSVAERAHHQRHQALDADLVVMKSNRTESGMHDTSSSSGNYITHVVDANIRPVNDQVPFAEVQLTAQHNVLANEQQLTDQSEPIYDTYLLEKVDSNTSPGSTNMSHRGGEIDQDAKHDQENVFANAALKNELRKLKGTCVDTKFAKPSILGKLILQPHRNQSVVRKPTAFKSERCKFSKPRFASQVDVINDLSKPVTPHYVPKVRESVFVKPHHVIASGSSRNSYNKSYGSNDMAHKYYLEVAKKKTQDKNTSLKPSVRHTTSLQNTTNGSKPKPRSNNQTSRSFHVPKSSCVQASDLNVNKMASADNTSGLALQRKERCTLQCALSLEEEKSSCLKPFSSISFMLFHARLVIKWINVPLIVVLFTCLIKNGNLIRLTQNSVSLTPYVPPSKKGYEILFQQLFDEYFTPPPHAVSPVSAAVAAPRVVDPAGSPSSATID